MSQQHLLVENYVAQHGGSRPAALAALNAAMNSTYTLSRLGAWLNRKEPLPAHVRTIMLPLVAECFASVWVPNNTRRAKKIAAVVVSLAA